MKKINQMDSIIQPIITEKATVLSEFNKLFLKYIRVQTSLILKNIEKLFKVKVVKINIINLKSKKSLNREEFPRKVDIKSDLTLKRVKYRFD